jgi:metallo-beta-lactamase family protein
MLAMAAAKVAVACAGHAYLARMSITFTPHGAAGLVTGSKHLLEVRHRDGGTQRILLDCGMFQGEALADGSGKDRNRRFGFDPASIDVLVLTHAHIDHSGLIPRLVRDGFRGAIWSTPATRDLCSIMLPDAAHIHEMDIKWLNKHRKRTGEPLLTPNYNREHAELILRQFITIGYHRPLPIAKGVTLTFLNAGHILGSAQILLEIEDFETKKSHRLLFSGDIGRPHNDLLDPAEAVPDIDILLMESTYGGRHHEDSIHSADHLCTIINKARRNNAKIIIPAFAVERTQQLLFTLDKLVAEGCIPPPPTFVDSPLAVRATEIFRLHLEDLREDVRTAVFMRDDPFGFEGLRLVRSVEESKSLNQLKGSAIIISASGMAESGRILHHLRNNIGHKRNIILFVGYCATNTLGWKLREGQPKVSILGDEFSVKAQIETLDSFSGHADHNEMLEYYQQIGGNKKQVFLVHGETDRSTAMQTALQEITPESQIIVPQHLQSVHI